MASDTAVDNIRELSAIDQLIREFPNVDPTTIQACYEQVGNNVTLCRQILSGDEQIDPVPNHNVPMNMIPTMERLSISFQHPLVVSSPPLTPTPDSSRGFSASPFEDSTNWSNATSTNTSEDEGGTLNAKLQNTIRDQVFGLDRIKKRLEWKEEELQKLKVTVDEKQQALTLSKERAKALKKNIGMLKQDMDFLQRSIRLLYDTRRTPQWKCRRCTYLNDYNLTACFMCEEPRHPEDEVSNPVASTTSPPPPPPPRPPPPPPRPNTSNEYWATYSERPYYIPPAPPSSSCVPLTPSSAPLTPNSVPLTPNSVPTTPNNVPLTSSSSSESVGYNHANRRVFFTQQSMSENSLQSNHSIRPSNYARSNSSASYTFGSDYQRANSFNENR